jgi:hypothetical protein
MTSTNRAQSLDWFQNEMSNVQENCKKNKTIFVRDRSSCSLGSQNRQVKIRWSNEFMNEGKTNLLINREIQSSNDENGTTQVNIAAKSLHA